jgi:ATP/maltotriose-dependent transcriptional regulator MalT
MTSTVTEEHAAAGGVFTPLHRPRVVERIAAAARQRVLLIVAPAGYGKSTALRQFLDGFDEPLIRYDLQADNATLLGFIRGLAEAISEISPDARGTVSSAHESTWRSQTPSDDLATWMQAHLQSFSGTIALDDLHVVEDDPAVSRFVAELIARTRGHIRWILASRTFLDLPIGTWTAYQEMDLAVDESDLRFTVDEARLAACACGARIGDEELQELLRLVEGWPTALSFALRSSTRSLDLRDVQATTRELAYRYLSEQVYHSLSHDERELLSLAALLPQIDVDVLRHAGCDNATAVIEGLRRRVSFIVPDRKRAGTYRCHDLFREFVVHQIGLQGDEPMRIACARAAGALEGVGDVAGALFLYARARHAEDTRRLLEVHGFTLLEEGHADAVSAALESLDARNRVEAMPLALRAMMEASAGRFERAVSQLKRAADRAPNAETRGQILLCAARVTINGLGGNPTAILETIENDRNVSADTRAEAASMLAVTHVRSGERGASEKAAKRALDVADGSGSPHLQVRVLQRTGVAAVESGLLDVARGRLNRCLDLCQRFGLVLLASRTLVWLYAVAAISGDPIADLRRYAQDAADAATRSGDVLDLQHAIESLLDAEMRTGNAEGVAALAKRHSVIRTSASRSFVTSSAVAWIHAWEGRFDEAHQLASDSWKLFRLPVARAQGGAVAAVWAAASGDRDASAKAITAACALAEDSRVTNSWGPITIAEPLLFCALAHGLSGRFTQAARLVRKVGVPTDSAAAALTNSVVEALRALKLGANRVAAVGGALDALTANGYAGYARLIQSTLSCANRGKGIAPKLTTAEAAILGTLGTGLTPKEIALESGRSVHTVRAHIQNAMGKLGCHGHHEAVRVARELGIITTPDG